MRNNKGFTLIELLVVIAIIGLLSTLAVIALNSARAKSRDSKRVSDIKQLQTALELYYADNNGYPVGQTAAASIGSGTSYLNLSSNGFSSVSSGTVYMGQVPRTPSPFDGGCTAVNNEYVYSAATTTPASTYSLGFCLGGKTGDLSAGPRTATPNGIQ
jgi:general secretion pathway protein G